MVEVETCDALTLSSGDVERLAAALVADQRIQEPLAALHLERGVVSVVFDVRAATSAGATAVAESVLAAALAQAQIRNRKAAITRLVTTRLPS